MSYLKTLIKSKNSNFAKVYDDRLTLWNAGTLPEELTIEQLFQTHESIPRNPLIAEVCYKVGYIDSWGRGVEKITDVCKEAGFANPQFIERSGGIVVELSRTSEKSSEKIIRLIQEKPAISAKDAEIKVKEKLKQLKEKQDDLKEKQKQLKTGVSAVPMPLLEVDGNGLASSGGLLKFAYAADKPCLFDDSLGRVNLYFKGKDESFFAAYFNPQASKHREYGQWEAYDPGLAISFNRSLETVDGKGKAGLLTAKDEARLKELLPTTKGLTMEAWIHPKEISGQEKQSRIIHYKYGKDGYSLGISKKDKLYQCFAVAGDKKVTVNKAYDFNQWRHLAVTYKKFWSLKLDNSFVNCGNNLSLNLSGEYAIEAFIQGGGNGTIIGKGEAYRLELNGGKLSFKSNGKERVSAKLDSGSFYKVAVIRSKNAIKDSASEKDYPITQKSDSRDGKWWVNKSSDEIAQGLAEKTDKIESEMDAKSIFGADFAESDADVEFQNDKYHFTIIVDKAKKAATKKAVEDINKSNDFSDLKIGEFSGVIDELRIWSRALNVDECGERNLRDKNGLLAWWRLVEGTDKFVYDDAGQNQGAIKGDYEWVDSPDTKLPRFNFFVDGQYQDSATSNAGKASGVDQLSLGGVKQTTGQPKEHFDGILEEIRIWGVSRSQEEISDNVFGRLIGEKENLLVNYTFDTNFAENKKSALAGIDGITEAGADNIWSKLSEDEIITVDGALKKDKAELKSSLAEMSLAEMASREGLVAHYPFKGDAGDASGNENNGKAEGATPTEDRFGNENGAYQFDGNARVEVSCDTGSTLSITGDLTIGAWIYFKGSLNGATILSKDYNGEFDLTFWKNKLQYYNGPNHADNNYRFTYPFEERKKKWCHIAVVRADKRVVLYVNGKLEGGQGALKEAPEVTSNSFLIGCRKSDQNMFRGKIHDVRVYNRALSSEEIKKITAPQDNSELVSQVLNVIESPPELNDSSYNSVTLKVEGQLWSGKVGKENISQVLSTAPVSTEIPAIRSALSGVRTEYNDIISGAPAIAEYGDVQQNEDGTINGILKRCYSFIRDGEWNLVNGYKVGNLVTEWFGQAQFNPQVMGFIEGPPPVPGENFPIGKDADVDTYAYKLDNSVELEESEEVSYTCSVSKESGFMTTAENEGKLGGGLGTIVAPLGLGISFEGRTGGYFKSEFESSNSWSESAERSVGVNKSQTLSASLAGYDNGKKGSERYYKMGNTGYALVKSKTADIYLLRLAHNNALVSMYYQPNPDIPEDQNIISFPIDPLYVKQGTLDGKFGEKTDDHYPSAHTYGEYSYFKPREAYVLKNRIEREKQEAKAYYENFNTAFSGEMAAAGAAMGTVQLLGAIPGYGPMITSAMNVLGGGLTTGLLQGCIDNKDKIADMASQRNLVNTYVWTVEGGFYAESTEVTENQQETYNGDFSLSSSGGGGVFMNIEAGLTLDQTSLFSTGSSFTMTKSKTKESSKSFGINVSVDIPTSPRYGYDGLVMKKDLIGAGIVDAYRFMSFYLEPQVNNYMELFTKVIDPIWLEGDDPNAKALKQARNDAKKPFCWRVMRRVTFVSRILPEFEPEAPPSLEKAMKTQNIESNYMLIKTFEPDVANITEPSAFYTKIDDVINDELPEFSDYRKEIKAYLASYFNVDQD